MRYGIYGHVIKMISFGHHQWLLAVDWKSIRDGQYLDRGETDFRIEYSRMLQGVWVKDEILAVDYRLLLKERFDKWKVNLIQNA